MEAAGQPLVVPPGRLKATGVSAAPSGKGELEAFGRVSLEGRLGTIPVSYVGDEKVRVACDGDCRIVGPVAPRLLEVLGVLQSRRRALEHRDPDALAELAAGRITFNLDELEAAAKRPVAAWFVRVDRNEAIVGEAGPDGVQKRLVLRRDKGGWEIASGLP